MRSRISLILLTFSAISHAVAQKGPAPHPAYDPRYWITVMPNTGPGCDPSSTLPNSAIIHRSFTTNDNYVTDGECHAVQTGDLIGSVQIIGGTKCRVSLHSGNDCEGWRWTPENTPCDDYVYASARIWCWDGRAYGPLGNGKRGGGNGSESELEVVEWSA